MRETPIVLKQHSRFPSRAAIVLILSSIFASCATTTQASSPQLSDTEYSDVSQSILNPEQMAYITAACSTLGSINPWEWPSTPQGLHLSQRARTDTRGIEFDTYVHSLPMLTASICESDSTSLAHLSAERAAALYDLLTAYYGRSTDNGMPLTPGSTEFVARHRAERPLLESLLAILDRIIQERR